MKLKFSSICLIAFFAFTGMHGQNKIAFGPYIQQMGTKDATICWSTIKDSITVTNDKGKTKTIRSYEQHSVLMGGLKPNTEYTYDVLNDGSDEGKGHFKTYPDKKEPFSFVVIGDSRNRHKVHAQIVNKIMSYKPRFIINSGDLVANGRSMMDWEAFFSINKNFMRNTPYYPVLGNHEKDSPYYYDFFDLPNNERYYYFTVGDALFIVLDSEGIQVSKPDFVSDEYSETYWTGMYQDYFVEQKQWLEKVLTLHKEAGYVFIFQHKPLYSIMKKRTAEAERTRAFWGDIFERHGVQVFMNGHDHHYHHAENNGVHFITSAGAGAPLYKIDAIKPETVTYKKIEHFVNIEIKENQAVLHVIDIEGNEFDKIVVNKRKL